MRTFGAYFFDSVFDASTDFIRSHPKLLIPESNRPKVPLKYSELKSFFGTLLIMSNWKGKKQHYRTFLKKMPNILDTVMGDDRYCRLEIPDNIIKLNEKKFDYINSVLDLGTNVKVQKTVDNSLGITVSEILIFEKEKTNWAG